MMTDEWAMFEMATYIDCSKVYRFVGKNKYSPIEVPISVIAHKCTSNIDKNSPRYLRADILKPVLLAFKVQNPFDKPYRMLDGRHRLLKTEQLGLSAIKAYLIDRDTMMRFVST